MRDIFFLTSGWMRSPAFVFAPEVARGASAIAHAAFSRDARRAPLADLVAAARGFSLSGVIAAARGTTTLSNTIAVCVRDSGDLTLIDVGWSAAACVDPARELGKMRARSLGVHAKAGDDAATQLRALGFDPARVTTIVATHLHLDHVGGVCDFPNAEVVTSDRELAAYRKKPAAQGYRAEDLARAGRIRTVPLDGAPSYGFPASADLFGDGEVVLLDANGHTAGSIAVALRTRGACYVHIGDAAYRAWEYAMSPPGPSLLARFTGHDRDAMKKTYAAIRSCEADPRRPIVVPSHDDGVFARLPHAPSREAAVA